MRDLAGSQAAIEESQRLIDQSHDQLRMARRLLDRRELPYPKPVRVKGIAASGRVLAGAAHTR